MERSKTRDLEGSTQQSKQKAPKRQHGHNAPRCKHKKQHQQCQELVLWVGVLQQGQESQVSFRPQLVSCRRFITGGRVDSRHEKQLGEGSQNKEQCYLYSFFETHYRHIMRKKDTKWWSITCSIPTTLCLSLSLHIYNKSTKCVQIIFFQNKQGNLKF